MTPLPTRCALVALIGQPNAGKSTLLNALVGARVGIISAKPNTTRLPVRGVQHLGEVQLVWLDTPGLVLTPGPAKRGFDRTLLQAASSAMAEADVVVIVAEAAKALHDFSVEARWIQDAAPRQQPVVLVLNKVDKLKDKAALLPFLTKLAAQPLAAVVPLSATKGTGLPELTAEVAKLAPVHPPMFPADMVTDQPLAQRLAELTREQLMRLMQAEVPYGITVATLAVVPPEGDAPLLVQQAITVAKTSHKPMVLGAGGQQLKRIGTQARHAMQEVLGQGVRLELKVRVAK